MSLTVQVKIRLPMSALERPFPYYLQESVQYNVDAFLLATKLQPTNSRVGFSLVLASGAEDAVKYTDLNEVNDVGSHLQPNCVLLLLPQLEKEN